MVAGVARNYIIKRLIGCLMFFVLWMTLSLGVACLQEVVQDPLEQEAQEIDKLLICPVCPSETLDQSQVPLAKQMKAKIRDLLATGYTRQEILDYFSASDRYGYRVLAEPPQSGIHLLVWGVPPAAIGVGILLWLLAIKRLKRIDSDDVVENAELTENLCFYLGQVDKELGTDSDRG